MSDRWKEDDVGDKLMSPRWKDDDVKRQADVTKMPEWLCRETS